MGSGANRRRRAGARRPRPVIRAKDAARPGEDARAPDAHRLPAERLEGGRFAGERFDGERFEALGRVMDALATDAEFMESCRDLTWWRSAGPGWHIEWREGPSATEAAALVADRAGPLTAVAPVTAEVAELEVAGVPFVLRAVDPLARERLPAGRGVWRLAEALDTTRSTAARHPWEELLGG